MNRLSKYAVALQLLAAAGLYGPINASAGEMGAMTREQHEEIAAGYDQEAKDLEAKIAQHEKSATVYESLHSGHDKRHAMQQGAAAHCRNLVNSYRSAIEDATELAKHHRMMANDATD